MTIDELAQQLEGVQSQLAFQEETIRVLNDVVANQDMDLHRLNRKVQILNGQLKGLSEAMGEIKADEKPPHY